MGAGNGFLSRLARTAVRRLARVYYPNIEITGGGRIPAAGPLLLAANHQNSMLDPVMVGIVARRPVRFLAKGPLFQIPIFGNILHALGMMPAYRRSDDPLQAHRNLESLGQAAARLKQGEAVGIFPEGKSHDAPRLEQVKTGAARMAIQAVREGAVGLKLVPIGLNYECKEMFRSAVWIRVGEPIDVNAWLANFTGSDRRAETSTGDAPVFPLPHRGTSGERAGEWGNTDIIQPSSTPPSPPAEGREGVHSLASEGASSRDKQAVRDLTAEIDQRLKDLVVHLDEPSWEPFLRELEVLLPPPRESRRNPFAWLRQRKRLADAMNHFMRADRTRADDAAAQLGESRAHLATAGLNARSSVLRRRGWRLALRLAWEAVLMDLGFVLVLIGTLHHLLPFLLTRFVARFAQAPGRSTISLARLGVGIPVYGAWYGFHAWWISQYFLPWVAWAWLLPMPFAGLLALQYWRRVKRTSPGWWRNIFIACQPARLKELRVEHDKLRELLTEMAGEYAKVCPPEPLPLNTFSWRRLAWSTARWVGAGAALFLIVAWFRTQLRSDDIHELGKPAPHLRELSTNVLSAALEVDEQTLTSAIDSLHKLETNVARLQAEFLSQRRDFYSQADNDAIRQAMLSYLACRTTLLGLVWKYQHHEEIDDERLRWRGFLSLLASASAISDSSLKLVTRFEPHPASVRKLNEADAAWGLPPGVFDMVKRNLLQSQAREFMDVSLAAYRSAESTLKRLDLVEPAPFADFHKVIRQHAQSRDQLFAMVVENNLTEPFKEAARMTKGITYRGQAFVSTWLGSTRFRQPRGGELMIRPPQLAEFRAKLKPGDILIERQNWFLSRALMPGYWAHAALYVGTTNDLVRLGLDRDPRVAAQWKSYAARDAAGHEHLILEAVPEGVRVTTLEHCIGVADAAAVLRPRVTEGEVREAIARGFSHLGKSYDFDFDFFTSDRLVCTELVYRCYDGAMRFPLVDVMGRKTLPPTELVRKFVTERNQAQAQLECVCFLDSDEQRGQAAFKGEDVFITTIERPGLMLLPGRVD
jgi:1-acyl-sn-glycerol-3-phosphate acyltransferase